MYVKAVVSINLITGHFPVPRSCLWSPWPSTQVTSPPPSLALVYVTALQHTSLSSVITHHYHPSLSSVIIFIHHCHPSSHITIIISIIRHHYHPSLSSIYIIRHHTTLSSISIIRHHTSLSSLPIILHHYHPSLYHPSSHVTITPPYHPSSLPSVTVIRHHTSLSSLPIIRHLIIHHYHPSSHITIIYHHYHPSLFSITTIISCPVLSITVITTSIILLRHHPSSSSLSSTITIVIIHHHHPATWWHFTRSQKEDATPWHHRVSMTATQGKQLTLFVQVVARRSGVASLFLQHGGHDSVPWNTRTTRLAQSKTEKSWWNFYMPSYSHWQEWSLFTCLATVIGRNDHW